MILFQKKKKTIPMKNLIATSILAIMAGQQVSAEEIIYDDSSDPTVALKPYPPGGVGGNNLYPVTPADPETSGNKITINFTNSANAISGVVAGGYSYYSSAEVNGNEVNLLNGRVNLLEGGYSINGSSSSVIGNTVRIAGGAATIVRGGYANIQGNASNILAANTSNNIVRFSGGEILAIEGGDSVVTDTRDGLQVKSAANGNFVEMTGGTLSDYGYIMGGKAEASTLGNGINVQIEANNNTVRILDGNIQAGFIFGGAVRNNAPVSVTNGSANLTANNNEISISAGNINSLSILAGAYINSQGGGPYSAQGINNTVNILGTPTFSSTLSIYGVYLEPSNLPPISSDVFTGNTLNFAASPIKIQDMKNFEYYNFSISEYAVNGTILIDALGTVDLDRSKIEVKSIEPGNPLEAGEHVVLINAGTLNGTAITIDSTVTQGVSLLYDVNVEQSGNQVTATILAKRNSETGGEKPGTVLPQTKSFSEARLAGLAFILQGADMVSDNIWPKIEREESVLLPFVVMAGNHSRYNTGSHVKLDGFSAMTGLAYQQDKFSIAGFIEGGQGNYDSYNNFYNADKIHADGHTEYYGLGLLGEYKWDNNIYIDGSIRGGESKTDFNSNDLYTSHGTVSAHFKIKSSFISTHIGTGYLYPLTDRDSLDFSLKYLWTHQGEDSTTVAGDPIKFDRIDSHRARANVRLSHEITPQIMVTGTLGYEYEFDGKAKATAYHYYKIESPTLKGGTEIGEIGFKYTPKSLQNLYLDVNLKGYVGEREGISGSAQLSYKF